MIRYQCTNCGKSVWLHADTGLREMDMLVNQTEKAVIVKLVAELDRLKADVERIRQTVESCAKPKYGTFDRRFLNNWEMGYEDARKYIIDRLREALASLEGGGTTMNDKTAMEAARDAAISRDKRRGRFLHHGVDGFYGEYGRGFEDGWDARQPKPCVWRHQLGIMGYPGCMEDRHPSPQNGPYCPYCGGKIEDKPADSGDDANPAKEGEITNGVNMKYTTEKFEIRCNCSLAGECHHNDFAWKIALDACVDGFAAEMKRKLTRKFLEGKSGWDDPAWPRRDIAEQLSYHVTKGDMIDVANFAMFAWNQEP